MIYKGFKDISISMLGLGGLRFPVEKGTRDRIDRERSIPIVDYAIECGINYIDTAYTYNSGDSETFLGEALSRHPRDSYYLATKFYSAASKDIRSVFEEQLRRLRTDHFDFYLLHSLDENYFRDYTDREKDYIGYLLEQKARGRIRYLGFSSHAQPETLERFLDYYDGFDMAQIQLNYLDWKLLDAKRQYEILTEHDIPVWVMEPLKGGRLVRLAPEASEILKAADPASSIVSWSFRFLMGLQNVHTVLSGMASIEDVDENVRIFSEAKPLSEVELKTLERAAEVYVRYLGVPCSSCRYCCSTCPMELEIPQIISAYNEYRISGETWKVVGKREFAPERCIGCGACRKRCPQKIDIPGVMGDFKKVLGRC